MERKEKSCNQVPIVIDYVYVGDRLIVGGGCEVSVTVTST